GVRPGLPDGVDQVRPAHRTPETGPRPARTTEAGGRGRRPAIRSRRRGAGRAERLLPAPRRTRDVRPAQQPESAQHHRPALDLLGGPHRLPGGARCPVQVPRPDEIPNSKRGGDAVNLFVADPHWGVWIVLYFFLGGIAAGAYLLAVFLEWFGTEADA